MDNTESSGIKSESEATGGSHAEASCLLRMEVFISEASMLCFFHLSLHIGSSEL